MNQMLRLLTTGSRICRVTVILLLFSWTISWLLVSLLAIISIFVSIPFTDPLVKSVQTILYKSELILLKMFSSCFSSKPSLHILVKNEIISARMKSLSYNTIFPRVIPYFHKVTFFLLVHIRDVFIVSALLCICFPSFVTGLNHGIVIYCV